MDCEGTLVPKECSDHDGNNVIKDVYGCSINLARCKLHRVVNDNYNTEYCDEIRAMGMCPKGLK